MKQIISSIMSAPLIEKFGVVANDKVIKVMVFKRESPM
jgi:hypothetical protein